MARLQLIDQIERDALDSKTPLSDALRKVVALGGKVNSQPLRAWASAELSGYSDGSEELPEYRQMMGALQIDWISPAGKMTGQPISTYELPDVAQGNVTENVPVPFAIAEVEAMVEQARRTGASIKLAPPGAQDLVLLMNNDGDRIQTVLSLYWSVSPVALIGVVDRVRTILVQMVAEMRAEMPAAASIPSPEVAANALNLAVGKKSHVVINQQIAGDGSTQHQTIQSHPVDRAGWLRRFGAFIVGASGVIVAAVTVIVWHPW